MRIGVLSDTHDYFDPSLCSIFHNVDHLIHAGDIGQPRILQRLEQIAPVTAVAGNTDHYPAYRVTAVLSLHGLTFLVHHIVDPLSPAEPLARRIREAKADIVVFGHTHRRYHTRHKGKLYLNPGYAGRPQGNQHRTVALITIDEETKTKIEFRDLDSNEPKV